MSGIALKELPFTVDAFRYARNGAIPDARFFNRVANAQNHILAYRGKQVFNAWDASFSGSGTTTVQHRWRFHAGYGVRFVVIELCMSTAGHPSTQPYATIAIDVAGAGTPATTAVSYGQANAGTSTPDLFQWSKRAFSVTANTTYEMSITVDNEARVFGVNARTVGFDEVDSSRDYYVDGGSTYGVINDGNRQRFTLGLSSMWKRNGAHLLNWSCNGTAATITGATWTNPTDATTAVASTSAGYILGSSLLTPYGRRVQPLKATLCVYGQVSGGAGTGEVRLYSDSGSGTPTFATVTGIGTTLQWYTLNQTIPSGGDALSAFSKVDLQHRMNGAGTLNLYAVSLYLYET